MQGMGLYKPLLQSNASGPDIIHTAASGREVIHTAASGPDVIHTAASGPDVIHTAAFWTHVRCALPFVASESHSPPEGQCVEELSA